MVVLDQYGKEHEHDRIVGTFSTEKGTLLLYRNIDGEPQVAIQYANGDWRRTEIKDS